jgi:hypothetical protein
MIPPESPAHGAIIKGIVDHLNVTNREEIMAAIDQANQPNPQAQEAEQANQQMQQAITQGQVQLLNAQAAESQSRAQKYGIEAQLMPEELALKYAEDESEQEFQLKAKMGELLLREQELQVKQDSQAVKDKTQAEVEMVKQLTAGMSNGPADPTSAP